MTTREATFTLDYGRTLGYVQRGPADGTPVFYFHGCPGSRLDTSAELDALCDKHGIRLIAVDRPGFGLSDPCRGRTLGSWAIDVADLADGLELERFAVYGLSAGGPYALATAAVLGGRVTRVAVAVGVGPPHADFFEGMGGDEQILYRLARRAPWLVRLGFAHGRRAARRDPEKFAADWGKNRCPRDRELLALPHNQEILITTFLEALRQGTRAAVTDTRLFGGPWDFDPGTIAAPVDLWHGDRDNVVPIAHAERVAALIAGATLHRCPGEGHFLAFDHVEEILARLAVPAT